MSVILYTVGYQGCQIDDFISALRQRQVEVLVDVRELPLSRKRGFSKRSLSESLNSSGIAYEHWRPLGSPKPLRLELRATGDWDAFADSFVDHLKENSDTLQELVAQVSNRRSCLMCFEADPQDCHRSLVAEKASELSVGDMAVQHIRIDC